MHTLNSAYAGFGAPAPQRPLARFAPMAGVLALHVLLFWCFYSGLMSRVAKVALPEEVFISFVSAPTPPKPAAAPAPKVAQLAPPPVLTAPPVVPVVIAPAAPPMATTPAPAAASAEKAAPAAAPVIAAAPAPATVSGPKTISSGVEYIQAPQPVYPNMSKRLGEQGKVILLVLINEKGTADKVVVQTSSGWPRLDEAGRQAAMRALFKPHVEDGRAVPVYVVVPLNFSLAS